ncbi:endonuclease domain-containing protein [Thermomonospora cellulosilytica]|uniref:Uncharacterized protein (DUF2237 family) n=1 Tax=Thermomonospora cellulosilytica TaxID=1411118 RepID=A0A7W3N1I7_9ACTN|nr:endonuclease domain-containing protein [Thermomonospora cellulosilytica]MBA9005860.1 uncharacterized protein (DUF2237 family) [Thermomonospora cellulosilytica]
MSTASADLGPHTVCATHTDHKLACEEYDALRARAGDRCEICGETSALTLHIDHDRRIDAIHAVRGLLCAACNVFMGRVDQGARDWPAAEEYERNAWYLGRTYVMPQHGVHPRWRAEALETARCLGIGLRTGRHAVTLPDDRRRWVDAFRQVCAARQPSRVETLRFWHYLRHQFWLRPLPEPLAGSMDRVLTRVLQRREAVLALASTLECPYCGVMSGPCVAGRSRKPSAHLHEGRRLRAQRQYDDAPL